MSPKLGNAVMRYWILATVIVVVCVAAYFGWQYAQTPTLPDGIVGSNGRIEAVEIDIATKTAGRLAEVLVDEGDFVTVGQVLAKMDTKVLEAELKEAEADLRRAQSAVGTAESSVQQRESEKAAAESVVLQREAERDLANSNFERAEQLVKSSAVSKEDFDTTRSHLFRAKAALSTSQANVAGAEAAIGTAKSQVIEAQASVIAAQAKIERIQADINDSTLTSPRDGRVQYRIAQPGEVLSAGGKVLNLVDLGDVYMTFFLPTKDAGRIALGAQARVVLDAAPHYVAPAHISYVADVAQFTPKTVETAEERQKLMFRLKARIEPDVLKKYIRSVKTGLPGMTYVRWDERVEWPDRLQVNLPQ